MPASPSPRLAAVVNALPLRPHSRVLPRVAGATRADARLFIDGGDPLRELPIPRS